MSTARILREDLHQRVRRGQINGDQLPDRAIVANTIVTMVGGQETTTNLIGNGLLALLKIRVVRVAQGRTGPHVERHRGTAGF